MHVVNSILPERFDWPSAIGSFLLNFGYLDYLVFAFLKDHLSESDFEPLRKRYLKDRLQRIDVYLEVGKAPEKQLKDFRSWVTRLTPLRELRNHIAHGHILFRTDPETNESRMTLFKSADLDNLHRSDACHVNLEELVAAHSRLSELVEELKAWIGYKETESVEIIPADLIEKKAP